MFIPVTVSMYNSFRDNFYVCSNVDTIYLAAMPSGMDESLYDCAWAIMK